MSLRVCILGNSHVACVREALGQSRARRPATFELFAAHANGLDDLIIRGGKAIAGSQKLTQTFHKLSMRGRFDLNEFDAFVIVGCEASIFRAVLATNRVMCWHMPSLEQSPSTLGKRQLVSEPCFRQVLVDALEATVAHRLVRDLHAETDAPIFLCPQPRPSTAALGEKSRFPRIATAARTGDAFFISRLFREALEQAFGSKAKVLHQPGQTITSEICTDNAHTEGSLRLAARRIEHDEKDVIHANPRYGALILDQITEAVTATLPEAASAVSA